MKSDADIQSERTAMEPIVGTTFAEWYAEACRLEYDTDPNVLLWACRTREVLRRLSIDLGAVSAAADQLVAALSEKGITVGLMRSSGQPNEYLAYSIRPGSELCDLRTLEKLIAAEELLRELLQLSDHVDKCHVCAECGNGQMHYCDDYLVTKSCLLRRVCELLGKQA